MKIIQATLLSFILVTALLGQESPAPKARCTDGDILVKAAWDIEARLIAAPMAMGPASDIKERAAIAGATLTQLAVCGLTAESSDTRQRFMAEYRNLSFILDAQRENGGLATGSEADSVGSFPLDLGVVAPSCGSVLKSNLVWRIESYASTHVRPADLKLADVIPLYVEATQLTPCAYEAQVAGYKDAAIRLLRAALTIETRASIAQNMNQNTIIGYLQRAAGNSPTVVNIGPKHCRATILNLGASKTVDWDCY